MAIPTSALPVPLLLPVLLPLSPMSAVCDKATRLRRGLG